MMDVIIFVIGMVVGLLLSHIGILTFSGFVDICKKIFSGVENMLKKKS